MVSLKRFVLLRSKTMGLSETIGKKGRSPSAGLRLRSLDLIPAIPMHPVQRIYNDALSLLNEIAPPIPVSNSYRALVALNKSNANAF